MLYDFIIIGGGVAGLFSALRLETKLPHARILILEKNAYLGGRTRMETFHSHKVVTGAGVGRFPKDVLLRQLVEASTGKPVTPIPSTLCYQFEHPVYTLDIIRKLGQKKKFIQQHRSTMTFRDFFLSFYSVEEYTKFCDSNGFTDFERADIVDTLYDYGFEDNVPGTHIFKIDWNHLVRYLRRSLHHTTIHLRTEVASYDHRMGLGATIISVKSKKGKEFCAKNLIFAGSIEHYPFPVVHQQIGYNSFLRMYSYTLPKKEEKLHRQGMTYYSNPLQKSIYLSPTLRTISYSDNEKALEMMRLSPNQIKTLAGYDYEDSVQYFWERGTHFYRPLSPQFKNRQEFIRYAQHPAPCIFLVGECISQNQGWTEGALESVLAIEKYWVLKNNKSFS